MPWARESDRICLILGILNGKTNLEIIHMATNQFSTTLTQKDRDEVMAAIATIKDKLPFLIDLTPEQRKSLPKMGDKSRAFCHDIFSYFLD